MEAYASPGGGDGAFYFGKQPQDFLFTETKYMSEFSKINPCTPESMF